MKDIIFNPIIITLLGGFCLISFLILFQYSLKEKVSKKIETFMVLFFLFLLMEIRVPPFSFLRPSALAGLDKTLASAAIQIGVYLFFVILLKSRFKRFFQNLFSVFNDPFLVIILLLSALSGFWSETPDVSFKGGLIFVGVSLFTVHIAKRYSLNQVTSLFRWLSIYLLIPCILVSVAIPSIGYEPEKGGWQGVTRHPIALGTFAALSFALWVCHLLHTRKEQKISIAGIFISLIALLGSKSSQAIFVVITLVGIILVQQMFKRLQFRQAIVTSVFFSMFTLCSVILIKYNLEAIVAATGRDLTLTGRTEFWPQVLRALNNHNPILGYGFTGFWQAWRGSESPARNIINPNGFVPPNGHNGFLDLALQIGWLGLFLFFVSLSIVAVKSLMFALKNRSPESIIPLIFTVYILMANISETQLFGDVYVWFMYVFLAVSPELRAKESSSRTHSIQSLHY
jgi:O-antigen ligase